jgi:hypothetical protein
LSLVSDVQQLIDETAGAVFWPAAQVYDAINEAQIYYYAEWPIVSTSTSVIIPENIDFMPIPSGIMILKDVRAPSGELFSCSYADLERHSRNWMDTNPGEPRYFIPWDCDTIRVYPRPDAAYTRIFRGTPWPAQIDGATQDITIDSDYKSAIAHEAVAILLEATRPDLADIMRAEAEDKRLRAVSRWRRMGGHNTTRLRPATTPTDITRRGVIQFERKY